jgi:hypothetical protein
MITNPNEEILLEVITSLPPELLDVVVSGVVQPDIVLNTIAARCSQ